MMICNNFLSTVQTLLCMSYCVGGQQGQQFDFISPTKTFTIEFITFASTAYRRSISLPSIPKFGRDWLQLTTFANKKQRFL